MFDCIDLVAVVMRLLRLTYGVKIRLCNNFTVGQSLTHAFWFFPCFSTRLKRNWFAKRKVETHMHVFCFTGWLPRFMEDKFSRDAMTICCVAINELQNACVPHKVDEHTWFYFLSRAQKSSIICNCFLQQEGPISCCNFFQKNATTRSFWPGIFQTRARQPNSSLKEATSFTICS